MKQRLKELKRYFKKRVVFGILSNVAGRVKEGALDQAVYTFMCMESADLFSGDMKLSTFISQYLCLMKEIVSEGAGP